MGSQDIVARLRALIEQHAPRRVLVLTQERAAARWLQRLVVDDGPVIGLAVSDLDGLVETSVRELHGAPLDSEVLLGLVGQALAGDATFEKVADQLSYQREVLDDFVRMHRALGADIRGLDALAQATTRPRDNALAAAFQRFVERLPAGTWYAGNALEHALAGLERAPSLARRSCTVALGFDESCDRWASDFLDRLDAQRWSLPRAALPEPMATRLRCAGPEAEIGAVARRLRRAASEGRSCTHVT